MMRERERERGSREESRRVKFCFSFGVIDEEWNGGFMVLERGGGGGVLWYSFSRYSFWQFMRGLTDIGFSVKTWKVA